MYYYKKKRHTDTVLRTVVLLLHVGEDSLSEVLWAAEAAFSGTCQAAASCLVAGRAHPFISTRCLVEVEARILVLQSRKPVAHVYFLKIKVGGPVYKVAPSPQVLSQIFSQYRTVPPVLSRCPLHTNSGCGKERRIIIGPW